MKAFVVLALVAVAAARSMDVDTMRMMLTKEKPFLHKNDLLLKEKDMLTNTHRFTVPRRELSDNVRGIYDDSTFFDRRVTVVPLEELVHYPLFQEYYRIPLFRQFWEEYPVVFRRYVESPLFQQFWTIPEFQSYFRNPVLFYKYIYPQIQIIAQRVVVPTTYDNMDVEDYYRRPSYDREERVGDYWSRFFGRDVDARYPYADRKVEPFGRHFDREINVKDFWNRLFRHNVDTDYPVVEREGYYYPTHNQWYTPTFGHRFNKVNNEFSTKYLLEKMFRHMYNTNSVRPAIVGDVTEVVTDVKMAPVRKEVVEPMTGETKFITEPRVVDVKVAEHVLPETEVRMTETETEREIKEHILRRMLVNKHITYEMYRVLYTLPLHHVKEIVRRIDPTIVFDPIYSRYYNEEHSFPTHHRFVDVNDVVNERPEVNEILRRLSRDDVVGDRYTPIVRDLMKVFRHRDYVPTVEDIIRPRV
jgi:hypothetical protein